MKLLQKHAHKLTQSHTVISLLDQVDLIEPEHLLMKANIIESIFSMPSLTTFDLLSIYSNEVQKGKNQNQ